MRWHHKSDPFRVEFLEPRRLLSLSVGGDSALNGYAYSVATADFNGDGRSDFATIAHPDTVTIMLGNSNGTFTAGQQLPAWSGSSIDAGDLNGDGKVDLVTTVVPFGIGGSRPWLQVFAGNGNGTFQPRQFADLPAPPNPPTGNNGYYALAVKIADVDADGKADLVAGCQYEYPDPAWDPDSPYPPQTFTGNYLAVLRGNGNAAFTTAFVRDNTAATDVETHDLNGDGKLDLVLQRSAFIEILLGAGNGAFSAGPSYFWNNSIPETDTAIALADFNGDGKIDLAATGNKLYVALGNGNGGFATPVGYPAGQSRSRSLAAADFNLDGRPDIVAGNVGTSSGPIYADGKVSVLLNDGGDGFRAPLVPPCGPSDGYAEPFVAAADFNGDGRLDVAATSYFQRSFPTPSLANVRLLVNDGQWPAPPPEPVGPEFLVHAPSADYQNYPDVAADAAGNFVVVWNSQSGAVFDPYQVYARRFSAAGQPLGDEFLVSQTDGGFYTTPAVAMDPDGDFVVAWRSQGEIVARLFDAAGRPRGATFPVSTDTAGGENPDVAMDADGDIVVAWQTEYEDGSQFGIYARRFTAAGTPLGADFRVNTFTQWSQESPTVAMDSAGDAVVAWTSIEQADSPFDIYAQLYDAAGARRGEEFRVNTITAGQQDYASVTMDAAGNFVVAWDSLVPGDWSRVYARRYDSAGLPRSGESRVGTSETGHELRPSAALASGGQLTVGWSWMSGFVEPSSFYARSYDASGAAGTEQLLVNPTVDGGGPVAAGPGGGFVAAWWHQYSSSHGIDDDIYARVFAAPAPPPAVTQVYVSGSDWTTAFKQYLAGPGAGVAQYGFAVSEGNQLDALPWVNLDRVSVTFSGPVRVAADDLRVRGVIVPEYPVSGFAYDPATRTATWTLSRPLANDRVELELDSGASGITDAAGRRLDGEWVNGGNAFPSGDGTPGGDFRFAVNVLTGDVNRDGIVLADDFSAVKKKFFAATSSPGTGDTAYSVYCDVDGSGIILANDFSEVKKRFFNKLPTAAAAPASAWWSTLADTIGPARTARPPRRGVLFEPGAGPLPLVAVD